MNATQYNEMYNAAGRLHLRRNYGDPAAMEARIRRNIGRGRGPHATLGGDVAMNPEQIIRQEQAALNMHRNFTGFQAAGGPREDFPGDDQSVHDDLTRMHSDVDVQGQAQGVLDRLENERSTIGNEAMQQQESLANAANEAQAQRAAVMQETALAPAAEAETVLTGLV